MSLTLGLDFMAVDGVASALCAHPVRYLDRIYTETELRECRTADGSPDPSRLAARFAAKEATMKALRVSDEPLPWRSIGVRTEPSGAPSLELTGHAERLARRREVSELHLSLTHEGPLAAAVVIAVRGS
jgi:holo-[acyl-carrier protein] synthase